MKRYFAYYVVFVSNYVGGMTEGDSIIETSELDLEKWRKIIIERLQSENPLLIITNVVFRNITLL